jgi:hypothetical protein
MSKSIHYRIAELEYLIQYGQVSEETERLAREELEELYLVAS